MPLKTRHKVLAISLPLLLLVSAGAALFLLRSRVHPGADVDTSDYAITGIDVSAHNGTIDFKKVNDSGIDFVIFKATEGSDFRDRRFEENYSKAIESRLYIGAYHFFRFDVDGVVQARNFMSALDGKDIALPVAIDVEEQGNPHVFMNSLVVRRIQDMIDELTANEYPVMLYTNKDGYERFIRGNFDDYPLWICTFSDPDPDTGWTLWQYSHRGRINGISGDVDLNLFYGNLSQWEEWIQ